MKCFYSKNKKSIWLFIIIFTFLFFYDFFLIALINDLTKVKSFQDVYQLYALHPYLPLSRIIKGLFNVQSFDHVGVKEVFLTFTYIVGSLSIFEILFLISLLFLLYQFLIKQDHINTLTMGMVVSHLLIFIFHICYSIIKLTNSFIYTNSNVYETMMNIRVVTIVCLVLYAFILFTSIFGYYIIYINKR